MKPVLLTSCGKPLCINGDSFITAWWAVNSEFPGCETCISLNGPQTVHVEESVEKVYEKLLEVA